eukprot:TRINITY_DN1961_c3_g1_i1.p1 TRINITY_DN1961_c3_g1~~TRINITY_DN1961_c3_g1_i1.p1  ORF type:complete len:540 (+),score=83.14 TRINITY_DN1961_c3_g1_i1:68-1621(+)
MEVSIKNSLSGEWLTIVASEGDNETDVKNKVAEAAGLPADKFKLLLNGKEVLGGIFIATGDDELLIEPSKHLIAQKYFSDMNKQADILDAVRTSNLLEINYCHDLDPTSVNTAHAPNFTTPVCLATHLCLDEVASLLLSLGADALQQDKPGWNMAHYAAFSGSIPLLKQAFTAGCPMLGKTGKGMTVFHIAANRMGTEVLEYLMKIDEDRKARVGDTDNSGWTMLHYAANSGRFENARILVDTYNHPVDVHDVTKHAPLHYASAAGDVEFCSWLLGKGASVKQTHARKSTPLHFAAQAGHADITSLLIQHGADLTVVDKTGKTPLHRACIKPSMDVIGCLIEHGSDASALDSLGDSILSLLTVQSVPSVDVVRVALEKGGEKAVRAINSKTKMTPLHNAARRDSLSGLIEPMVRMGGDVNAKEGKNGSTPLHLACREGNEGCVGALLSFADPTVTDKEGNTALHISIASTWHPEVPLMLVGAFPEMKSIRNTKGLTPLELADALYPSTHELTGLLSE